ncbi:MAG: serine protease-like protein [Thermodesulfobacteriota bacterium]|nr:MAG: serine protease-like protein [Thermodesulfobacteriota bacterium]
MSEKLQGKIILSIFLIFVLLFSANLVCTSKAQFVNERVAEIKAVAVKSGEKPEGVVIDITVIVTPGTGRVFVSTTPYTEIDMQGSAQLAALTACDLLGLDFMKYNFFYIIEADAPIVGGPSAGGVMTIATLAALKNLMLKPDVYMTGMIYPDGFIGPVGGIPYKLEAAAKKGAKYFLIPKGQRIVYIKETKEERHGPFIFISTYTKPLDVVEYGKNLGVNVVEVETVADALKYYTGFTITKPEVKFNISAYSEILKKLANKMKEQCLELRNEMKNLGIEESSDVSKLIEDAEKNYNAGYYYTSTSRYFAAKIKIRALIYKKTITDKYKLEDEFKKVEDEINSFLKSLKETEKVGIQTFQLYGAAEERISKAKDLLEKARESRKMDIALDLLAFAKERIESAKLWLSLLEDIKEDILIKKEDLKRRAQFYLSQAESLIVYASKIGGYADLLQRADESLSLSKEQFDSEFYSGAAISAINSITEASLSIELINADEELVKSKIESSKEGAEAALSEVEEVVFPVLPVAYYEFAQTAPEALDKLTYYKLSERLSKLIASLAKIYPESEIIEVKEFPTPYTEIKETPTPKVKEKIRVSPGFEVIGSIVALMLVFILFRRMK